MKPKEILKTPSNFREHLIIDGTSSTKLGDVLEPFQKEDFAAIDQGWMHAAGISQDPPKHRFAYLERPRGHSKTTDVAAQILWALCASPVQITGIATASDEKQAKLTRDAINRLVNLNPWVKQRIQVNKLEVVNKVTDSSLTIISSDADSSLGWDPQFIVCDELTKWGSSGIELWDSILSSAGKRPNCFLTVISNAGKIGNSWQWNAREKARVQDAWYFHSLDGPQASWITPETLQFQRDNLLPSSYQRYWLNRWVPDSGGDHLDERLIQNACRLAGPNPEPNGILIGGLDIGVKRDASAFTVLKVDLQEPALKLVHHTKWLPADQETRQVSLNEVENHIAIYHRKHSLSLFFADSWQAEQMCQNLSHRLICQVVAMNPAESDFEARSFLRSLQDGLLWIYPDDEILEEWGKVLLVEKSNDRLKIEAPRDETGHCDITSAIAVSIGRALAVLENGGLNLYDDVESVFQEVAI